MGYAESKYYGILEELADRMLKGEITQEEMDEASLKALDDELGWPDDGGHWLAVHFEGTAEYMVERLYEDCEVFMPVDYLISQTEKEIEILRKHGFDFHANACQEWLDIAVARKDEFKVISSKNE